MTVCVIVWKKPNGQGSDSLHRKTQEEGEFPLFFGEKKQARRNVVMVPKVIRHGKAIRGSQSGRGRGGRPTSLRRSEGSPERTATVRNPATMAIRLPVSLPRFFVRAPNKKIPSKDP